ncbi:DUF1499 domain containing protein [Sulfitobacter donghicola DSW-25 = KCTC 12864 = JCM 14565]|nr:DUF1499 domain containing protein [Sulfitobacter donghicola DSW-25 = KCTC 12864 = JCM 14565]
MALVLLGARFEIWQPVTGFGFYRSYFNPLAMIITGVGLFALVIHLHRSEKPKAALGGVAMIFGVICLVPMISNIVNPKPRAAPIHNISTDTVNPPAFLVLDETRAGARNPLAYGGAEQAAAQTAAYPDIGPLETELTADAAYQRALTVAQDMGWDIIAADTDAHRFEATARTSVFYFADDVVVVVSSTATGSRVDMRSVSRIGRSDQGVNAARIRLFQKQFNEGV